MSRSDAAPPSLKNAREKLKIVQFRSCIGFILPELVPLAFQSCRGGYARSNLETQADRRLARLLMSGCLLKVQDEDSAFVSTFVVHGGTVLALE